MSAYMCDPETIMALALALNMEGLEIEGASDVFSLFERLRGKNIQAMDTRYENRWDRDEEAAYPEDLAGVMRAAADRLGMLVPGGDGERGLIKEFDYQASECEDWDNCPESLALSSLSIILESREKAARPAREAAARAEMAQACATERARILAAFPFLDVEGATKRSGNVLAAHNLRAELRRAFPGIKFSVTSSSFSGGNSVSISWTDGPTRKAVEEIADKYEQGTFNGMDDSYTYRSGVARVWGDTFGSSRWVHADNRNYSEAAYAWAIPQVLEAWAGPEDAIPDWTPHQVRNGLFNGVRIRRADEYLGTLVYRLLVIADAKAWEAAPESSELPAAWSSDEEAGRVEIRFQGPPPAEVRATLKAEGFRWSKAAGRWWALRSAEAEDIARQLSAFCNFCAA